IDEIHPETAQRGVAAFDDVFAAETLLVGTVAHCAAYFGGDYNLIARSHLPQILAGDFFAQARRINIRCVEEIDPRVERDLEMLARILLVHVPAARAQRPIRQLTAAVAHASQTNA